MRGDCLRLMRRMPAASVQLVLCDPPFGITNCAWDRKIAAAPMWREYARLLAQRGAVILFATCPNCVEWINAAPRGWARYEWVWRKNNATGAGNVRKMPLRSHEVALVFYRELPLYFPQGLRPCRRVRRSAIRTSVYHSTLGGSGHVTRQTGWPKSVLEFAREHKAAPAQKPVALLEYLIRTYTREGDVVLDNTMGLGSTGVAAVRCGRRFVGMEIDRERFRRGKERIVEEMRRRAG